MKTRARIAFAAIGAGWVGIAVAAELIVSAASSLTNAFTEIGRAFEKANPPHRVIFNYAGSGQLLQQISRGAPVDVFASADQETMDRADQQDLIVRPSRTDFARNALVVVVPKSSTIPLSRLEDLKNDAVKRIAISNPETVPVGKYSKSALDAAGLFKALKEKYINTQNVRQSLDYVARGEVDVGFVYATDAAIMRDRVKVLFEVPSQIPIAYPIARIKGSGKESLSMRFIEFVTGPGGQAILAAHGLRKQ